MILQRAVFLFLSCFVSTASASETIETTQEHSNIRNIRRRLLDPRSVTQKPNEHFADHLSSYTPEPAEREYNVGNNYWCKPPTLPPIDYESCDKSKVVNAIPLRYGLTNGLKFMVLSVIKSLEQGNFCCYNDETRSIFPKQFGPFYDNYFEPIGLKAASEVVQEAKSQNRRHEMPWQEVWEDFRDRRVEGTIHNIDVLGYHNVEGHDLKRNMLKRIWRPLPKIRDQTCTKLEGYIQGKEYIALSMREGDKTTEGFEFATTEQYIVKVEEIVPIHFGGTVPLIFVATDSCDPLERLRKARPEWRIVSECDRLEQHGYIVEDQMKWTEEQFFEHYEKFWVELFAMAGAKVWIGVTYTNVSWWVYFMREKTEEKTFYILEGEGSGSVPHMW